MISDTRLPPAFRAFISGGRREPGDEVTLESVSSSARKPTKRRRVVLPIESKIAILDRLKGGASHVKIADEFGIGTSTVGDIKDKAKI